MAWTALQTYWSNTLNTAYTNGQIDEPDYLEATELLSRWITAEGAKDKAVTGSDIQSYSIAGRSVQRSRTNDVNRAATDARQAFFHKLYGSTTFADFRTNQEVTDDI